MIRYSGQTSRHPGIRRILMPCSSYKPVDGNTDISARPVSYAKLAASVVLYTDGFPLAIRSAFKPYQEFLAQRTRCASHDLSPSLLFNFLDCTEAHGIKSSSNFNITDQKSIGPRMGSVQDSERPNVPQTLVVKRMHL